MRLSDQSHADVPAYRGRTVLRDGGLVHSRRDGVQVIHSLSDETEITQVIADIRRIAEAQFAEMNRILIPLGGFLAALR